MNGWCAEGWMLLNQDSECDVEGSRFLSKQHDCYYEDSKTLARWGLYQAEGDLRMGS
jgi:hypothetical protein